MLDKAICKYRKGAFKRIEIIKHQNAYNYVKSFLSPKPISTAP